MNCLKHSVCDHDQVKCNCNKCWIFETQCEYAYNAEATTIRHSDEYNSAMGSSGKQRKLITIQNAKGTKIFIAPRRYVIQLQRQPGKHHITEKTNFRREEYNPPGTQLSIHSGTSSPIGFHFPDPGSREWAKYIRGIDEYKLTEDKKRFIRKFIRDTEREFQTNKNMDRNRERKRQRNESPNNNDGRSNTGNQRSESKYSRSNSGLRANVENKKKIHHSRSQRRWSRSTRSPTSERGATSIFELSDSEIEKYIIENDGDSTQNNQRKEETSTNNRRGTTSTQRGRRSTSRSSREQFGYPEEEKKFK